MSPEVIEAVFRYSHYHRKQIELIASKNQIDHSGGYVNHWNTANYMQFVHHMRAMYPQSDVVICRDHCGPGFNAIDDLGDTYATIENDIQEGFDLIHIDFCHWRGDREQQLEESRKAIEHCLRLKPNIYLEIGTDENYGANYNLPVLAEIAAELDYFTSICNPEFYVVQTGTVVREINQAGSINKKFIEEIGKMAQDRRVKLKEHNADYLSKEEIGFRAGVIDAMNIAPQLGVVQTSVVLAKSLAYGVNTDAFLEEVYAREKWKKWMHKNTPENKMLCCKIAGHYHFASDPYKKIIDELAAREDIKETLINAATDVINHYLA